MNEAKISIAAMIANYVAVRLAMSSAPLDPTGASQQLHDAINEGCQVANDLVYWSDKQLAAWTAAGGPLAAPAPLTVAPATPTAPAPVIPPIVSGIVAAAKAVAGV